MAGAQSALEEIFTELEMLIMHRVNLEMIYSNPLNQMVGDVAPDLMCNETPAEKEIIVLHGDEDTVMQPAGINGAGEEANTEGVPCSGELSN